MKIRWFQTYDKNGDESEKILQYWDKLLGRWEEVGFVRCEEGLEEEYNHNQDALFN